jgi:hypothetical protein
VKLVTAAAAAAVVEAWAGAKAEVGVEVEVEVEVEMKVNKANTLLRRIITRKALPSVETMLRVTKPVAKMGKVFITLILRVRVRSNERVRRIIMRTTGSRAARLGIAVRITITITVGIGIGRRWRHKRLCCSTAFPCCTPWPSTPPG